MALTSLYSTTMKLQSQHVTLLWCEKLQIAFAAYLSNRIAACLCAMTGNHPAEEQISNGCMQAACWIWSTCPKYVFLM